MNRPEIQAKDLVYQSDTSNPTYALIVQVKTESLALGIYEPNPDALLATIQGYRD
jgi:hypothetical protein